MHLFLPGRLFSPGYILPSILTRMLTAHYTIVDGLFIGRCENKKRRL